VAMSPGLTVARIPALLMAAPAVDAESKERHAATAREPGVIKVRVIQKILSFIKHISLI